MLALLSYPEYAYEGWVRACVCSGADQGAATPASVIEGRVDVAGMVLVAVV